MYFLFIPILFLSITPSLNEPVNLARSAILISWILLSLIAQPQMLRINSKWQLLILSIPFGYLISSIALKQNLVLSLLGNYNRNFGLFTLLAIGILVINVTSEKVQTKDFVKFAVLPVTIFSIVYSFVQSFDLDPIIWAETDRTVLTLGNSDYAAALLGVLIVVPIFGFFKFESKILKVTTVIPFLLMLRAGLNSQAYQFRVLAVFSVVVFLTVFFWPKIQKISIILRSISSLAIVTLVAIFVASNRSELISRTSFTDRISQQSMGLRMFSDHPIFGVGVDQF